MSAPASASPIATACPMPLVAPVTTAVEPSSENMDAIVSFFVYSDNQMGLEKKIVYPKYAKSRTVSI